MLRIKEREEALLGAGWKGEGGWGQEVRKHHGCALSRWLMFSQRFPLAHPGCYSQARASVRALIDAADLHARSAFKPCLLALHAMNATFACK